MPEISRFYGIGIRMFFGDHPPPHIHVRYAEYKAKLRLDGSVLDGDLPPRAFALVREWIGLHKVELDRCWARASRNESPGKIEPLP